MCIRDSAENGYTVLRLLTEEGEVITVVGCIPCVAPGEHLAAVSYTHLMERNRKDRNGGVLDTVAELFDLPADLVAGLPHLEMMGSRQLYLEHHTGILAYSDEQIDVNTTGGVLRVRGARLALMAMTAEELRIGGDIAAVEWVR